MSCRSLVEYCAEAELSAVQGLRKTCMYCGDGINDLIALGAADVGMTVGSSEASAAATISNRNSSIAGDSHNNSNSRCQSQSNISVRNSACFYKL